MAPYQRALVGFDEDENVDTTFGDNGRLDLRSPFAVELDVPQFPADWFGMSGVLVDSSDRILVLGRDSWSEDPEQMNVLLGRFTSNGEVDASFGNAGTVDLSNVVPLLGHARETRNVTVDSTGRILVVIEIWQTFNQNVLTVLLRLDTNERVQGVNLAKFSDGKFVAGAIFETQD